MDPLKQLREVRDGQITLGSDAYTSVVREAFRVAPDVTREFLQETYEHGLKAAYADGSTSAIARVALMGAALLDAVGQHEGAIARLEQARSMAARDPDASALVLATKAAYTSLSTEVGAARGLVDEALSTVSSTASAAVLLDIETTSATINLVLLTPTSIDDAISTISAARDANLDALASSLMVFLVAAHAATPQFNQAVAWADALLGYASAIPHRARELDATVAQVALRSRTLPEPIQESLDGTVAKTMNTIALWRLRVHGVYLLTLSADRDGALAAVTLLQEAGSGVHSGFTSTSGGFRAVVDALFEADEVSGLAPPRASTLLNLSGALASAEAVSIAGSQSAAADWLRWSEALPAGVVTTLEWPACRRRIEGLLLLRLGREREAVSRLQDAIKCCEERTDEIQAAIGRVQLAEALLRGRTASMIPRARTVALGKAGAEQLRIAGVDPIRFAYAASRTFLDEAQVPERGGLTPREAQVLGRLAQGMTYDEIGKDLEINPRTVGVHASHCYEKLGVRNRVEAVRLAQDLGIV